MANSIEQLINEVDIGIIEGDHLPIEYDNRIYMLGDNGIVICSDDFGKTWIPIKCGNVEDLDNG